MNTKRHFWSLFKPALAEFRQNDPLRMAGATAFFTTFALPPILIILYQVFSLFINSKTVGTQMVGILQETFGQEGARQIRTTTRGFRTIATNWYIATAGFLFLLFVATTLFTVIKNSLNDIWMTRVKEKPGVLFYLNTRGRSLLVILLAGLLFIASLFLKGILGKLTSVVVVSAWFLLLFRYLADARPSWKVATVGGLVTGILFSGGKILLTYLMIHSNAKSIYGASGSMVLLLLFVFYSSFILYYGASFIKVYAESLGQPLVPANHAFQYQRREVIT